MAIHSYEERIVNSGAGFPPHYSFPDGLLMRPRKVFPSKNVERLPLCGRMSLRSGVLPPDGDFHQAIGKRFAYALPRNSGATKSFCISTTGRNGQHYLYRK